MNTPFERNHLSLRIMSPWDQNRSRPDPQVSNREVRTGLSPLATYALRLTNERLNLHGAHCRHSLAIWRTNSFSIVEITDHLIGARMAVPGVRSPWIRPSFTTRIPLTRTCRIPSEHIVGS